MGIGWLCCCIIKGDVRLPGWRGEVSLEMAASGGAPRRLVAGRAEYQVGTAPWSLCWSCGPVSYGRQRLSPAAARPERRPGSPQTTGSQALSPVTEMWFDVGRGGPPWPPPARPVTAPGDIDEWPGDADRSSLAVMADGARLVLQLQTLQ